MDSRKWAAPVTVGNVPMCPHCLLLAVEHAFNGMMMDTEASMSLAFARGLSDMHWRVLNSLTDQQKQLFAECFADFVGDEADRCRYRAVHNGGTVVDKYIEEAVDDVPY